jgi:DNA replication licensing factor MCM4
MEQDVLDLSTLTDYVSYARKHIHPQLSDEAADELITGYVKIRGRGKFTGSSKKVIQSLMQIELLLDIGLRIGMC